MDTVEGPKPKIRTPPPRRCQLQFCDRRPLQRLAAARLPLTAAEEFLQPGLQEQFQFQDFDIISNEVDGQDGAYDHPFLPYESN